MANTQHAILLLSGLLCLGHVYGFSLNQTEFDNLVQRRCFNRSATTGQELLLGQNEPVGLSIENVISLIERLERRNPNIPPDQVLKLLLKRFHIDGVKYNGHQNVQSNVEFQHAELTRALLFSASDNLPAFPEDQFTEDEKCNLFFVISHVVNFTALETEKGESVYFVQQNIGKSQAVPTTRDIGDNVVIPTTPKAVQSGFLVDEPPKEKKKTIQKREVETGRLTKKQREYGVASFGSSRTNPIAVNRVLLGLLVGFTDSTDRKISEILSVLKKNKNDDVQDEEVDTLLAVTLSDLFGIDTSKGLSNPLGKLIFGADGEWNSTVCHTQFVLTSKGTWGTLAEFRGGLDGYNIGYYLRTLRKQFPGITASQVLRFYYSRNGLSDQDGVCQRGKYLSTNLKQDLVNEATKYLAMWNTVAYNNQHAFNKLTGYIKDVTEQFFDVLNKAATRNNEENAMCEGTFSSDIRSKPVESVLDALFLLDINRHCTQNGDCPQALYVSQLVKNLKLGRNLGTVSVLFNARGVDSPNLVDDEMNPVSTPLYSVLYNSTSNECASCKAAFFDSNAREVISDRVELLAQLNLTLGSFEEKRSNKSGVPGKAVFWFDFGTVQPVPTDKIQGVKYEQLKRTLLHIQRDWTWFGLGTNSTSLKDLVWQDGNLASVELNQMAISKRVTDLSLKTSEVPSVFQYGECKSRKSNNYTHEGLITPGFKQYWAIYPDTFRSSGKVDFRFSGKSNPIEVCQSRVPKPEGASENCKRASKANEEVSWTLYSPCKDLTFEKCPPIYFTITVGNSDAPICTESKCQNIDQVKWYFSHTGISCNRASAVSVSILFIAATSMLSYAFSKYVQ